MIEKARLAKQNEIGPFHFEYDSVIEVAKMDEKGIEEDLKALEKLITRNQIDIQKKQAYLRLNKKKDKNKTKLASCVNCD